MCENMNKIFIILILISVVSCTDNKTEDNGVITQLIDYQCKPIPNQKIFIKKHYAPVLPMAAGNGKRIETKTNDKGYFTFINDARSYDFSLMNMHNTKILRSIKRNNWGYVGKDKKSYTINENNQLNKTTTEHPLYIYKRSKLPEGINQVYDNSVFKIGFSSYNAHFKPKSIGHSPGQVVELGWSIKNGAPNFEVTALGNGKIVEITNKMHLLSIEIPDEHFKKSFQSTIDNKNMERVFLIKNKFSKSIFSINLVYNLEDNDAYVNTLFNSLYVDRYTYRKNPEIINKTHIPQDYCGGVLARWHNGYYGQLDKEKIEYLKAKNFANSY